MVLIEFDECNVSGIVEGDEILTQKLSKSTCWFSSKWNKSSSVVPHPDMRSVGSMGADSEAKSNHRKGKIIIKDDRNVPLGDGLLWWANDNEDLEFTTRVTLADKLGGLMLPVRPGPAKRQRLR